MPSACFQCVEALAITIGAINQNKIKIGSLAFGSLVSLFCIWIFSFWGRNVSFVRGLHVHTTVDLDYLTSYVT